ncbi:DUF945 family protein [Lampropedia cohaerens]|uniref:DUF945 family protein n=1 Tax=Lampropedia cohaerens TaxID=1610491 RepID=UPI0018D26778|nr:DUF945 family protein [Lampropedia cohaerens]
MAKSVRIAAAIALLVAAYGVATWTIGRAVEQRLRDGHAQFSALTGIDAQLVEYRRGLRGAAARTALALPGVAEPVMVVHHVAHGPWLGGRAFGLARIDSQSTPGDAALAAGALPHYALRTHVGLRGDTHLTLTGQPWSATDALGRTVAVQPLHAQGQIGASAQHVTGTLEWEGLLWRDGAGGTVQWRGLRGQAQFDRIAGRRHLYAGQAQLDVMHWDMGWPAAPHADEDATRLQLREASFTLESILEGEWLQWQMQASAAFAQYGAEEFGPVQTRAQLHQLHAATFDALLARLVPMLQVGNGVAVMQQLPLAEQTALREQAAALFGHGLTLVLGPLQARVADGQIQAEAQLAAPTLTALDLQFLPMSLVSRLDARMQLQLPQALATRWLGTDGVANLVAQHLAEQVGADLRADWVVRDAQLRINGRPVHPALPGQLLD